MPAHHRVGRDDPQVLAPAKTQSTSQDPQQLVPEAQPKAWSSASRSAGDAELMPQEQVLEYEVLARTRPGQDRREQQPEESSTFSASQIYVRAGISRPTTHRKPRRSRQCAASATLPTLADRRAGPSGSRHRSR